MATFTEKMKCLDRIRLILKRRYGEQPRPIVTHPVEHTLRAILAEEATAAQVDQGIERLRRRFVDWNDLRVSRPREIREALGTGFPLLGHKARVIPRLLDQVFKKHNSMVWDFLEEMGKVGTRTYFERLEEVRPFVAATIARDCVGAHTIPVDRDIARVLGRLGIVDPENQSEGEMQAFLERGVKSTRAYETHQLTRRLGEQLCVVDTPLCAKCRLNAICPSAVLPPKKKPKKAGTKKVAGKKKKVARKRAASRRAAAKKKTVRAARKGKS